MTTAPSIPMATSRLALVEMGTTAPRAAAAQSGIHQGQLDDVAERDDPDEGHHDAFDVPVTPGGDEQDLKDGGDHARRP